MQQQLNTANALHSTVNSKHEQLQQLQTRCDELSQQLRVKHEQYTATEASMQASHKSELAHRDTQLQLCCSKLAEMQSLVDSTCAQTGQWLHENNILLQQQRDQLHAKDRQLTAYTAQLHSTSQQLHYTQQKLDAVTAGVHTAEGQLQLMLSANAELRALQMRCCSSRKRAVARLFTCSSCVELVVLLRVAVAVLMISAMTTATTIATATAVAVAAVVAIAEASV
jgi:chromosome segregation ATPase